MKKYTNAWVKTDSNNHDCANDGTCGQSIRDFRIDNSNIFFHDGDGKTIAQIPYMPGSVSSKYNNNLYKEVFKEVFSENFDECLKYISIPKKIQDLLPNQFNFEYGKLNCVIHYDDVSQREQDQIKLDIQNAYDAYKAKFCINSDTQVTVNTYIFNNEFDYMKYGTLVPQFSNSQSRLNNSLGMTIRESMLLYKYKTMDKTLAHEFAHVFQHKFSTPEVTQLHNVNSELIANAIGMEVGEKNHEVKEKNYKALCEQKGVDEYKDFKSWFNFEYKGTNCTIYRHDLSGGEEEELQIINNVKNVCGLIDRYDDFGSWFIFEYKGTNCTINREDLSQEEKVQIIKNVRNVCGLVDKYIEYEQKFQIKYKGTTCTINRQNLSEEEKLQVIQNLKKNVCGLVDEYADHGLVDEYKVGAWTHHKFVDRDGWLFEFKYKGVFYLVQHKNLSEEEKFQIIQDIRSSYESLVSQCDRLVEKYKSLVVIEVDESKDIDIIYCYDINNYTLKELDKTLISRSKPEQEVDEVDNESPKPEKEPEVTINEDAGSEKEEQSKAENESPKPEKEPEVTINEDAGSEKEEQSKAEEEKSSQQDTQQPSNFLSNIIFSIIKLITDPISSFSSWLYWSKEEEPNQQNDNVAENFVNNHHLSDDYHPTDEIM